MKTNRPLILVSNDDGIQAKGLHELIKFLSPLGELIIMAPDSPRSGSGCALTVTQPVHYSLVRKEVGLALYKCTGTPADCIKLAMNTVVDRKPDLVIGGINHGENSAVSVHYSGTMGIAIEGCLSGIPSIGFSLRDFSKDADFSPCEKYVKSICQKVLMEGLPELTCLNVNIPAVREPKGVKICTQTIGRWKKEYEPCAHPKVGNYYWLSGEFINEDPDNEANDLWALDRDYVSIIPTTVDATHYQFMETLKNWDL